jgi:putative metalloprotease
MKITATTVLVALALAQPAYAGFDLGGLIDAGKDVAKAATLSDTDVKHLAFDASKVYDKSNKVAAASSPYAKRLSKLTKGMKTEGGLKLNIKAYLKDEVNAFAMADGTVRVYSGLMDKMTDDEVRYVIGHEIGHVSLGHTKKALQTAYTTSAARKVGAATGNGLVALSDSALGDLAENLVHAQFSQSQESDADRYALNFMKSNKYDTKAAVTALRKLEKMYGNDSSVFSSHPAPGDRADALEKEL